MIEAPKSHPLVRLARASVEVTVPGVPTLRAIANNVFATSIYEADQIQERGKPFTKADILIYAALDLARAAFYGWIGLSEFIQNRDQSDPIGLLALAMVPIATGIIQTLDIRRRLKNYSTR